MGISGKVILAVALAACLGARAAGSEGDPTGKLDQPVLMHDVTGVPADVLVRAKAEVERVFSAAGVSILWLDCSAAGVKPGEPKPCPPRPAGTIILRIVPATLDYLDASALGYALMAKEGALYATVSFPRVQQCILRQTTSAADLQQVLGHAMAHELGHILLGSQSHAKAGLMQAAWDSRALKDMSRGLLSFSQKEARRIRDEVVRRARGFSASASNN